MVDGLMRCAYNKSKGDERHDYKENKGDDRSMWHVHRARWPPIQCEVVDGNIFGITITRMKEMTGQYDMFLELVNP
eukprot:1740149-Ditylum_brightwellii.AAC.1